MPLTLAHVAERTAVSTAVYQKERLSARHIARLRRLGVSKIEISCVRFGLDYRDRAQRDALVAACRRERVDVVSVHGPFTLPYRGDSAEDHRVTIEESVAALEFAHAFGARFYVGHFGHGDAARRVVPAILDRTSGSGIVVTTENQTGQPLEPYVDIVKAFDSDRFGLTLDIGHARDDDGVNPFVKPGVSGSRLGPLAGVVRNTHLHETFDLDTKADHRPPLHEHGLIQWRDLLEGLDGIGFDGFYVFEDGRGEDPDDWVTHAATFAERYGDRYGT